LHNENVIFYEGGVLGQKSGYFERKKIREWKRPSPNYNYKLKETRTHKRKKVLELLESKGLQSSQQPKVGSKGTHKTELRVRQKKGANWSSRLLRDTWGCFQPRGAAAQTD